MSPKKTKRMLIKGDLSRKPIIKICRKNIEYVTQHTYLWTTLDEKLSFKQHLTKAANKDMSIFYKIKRGEKAS